MDAKKILFCLVMLCSITIVKGQASVNEVPTVIEMTGELVTKVKLAKEYFMTSTDVDAGKTYEERTNKLTAKVKELFTEYKNSRTEQNKKDSIKSQDSMESISSELKVARLKLQYMNLPSDI
jgi:multidrug resistance efflux pump